MHCMQNTLFYTLHCISTTAVYFVLHLKRLFYTLHLKRLCTVLCITFHYTLHCPVHCSTTFQTTALATLGARLSFSARLRCCLAVRHFLQQFGRKTTKFTALDKGNKINSPRQKSDTWRLICTRPPANCTRIDCKCDLLQLRVHHTLTSRSQEISVSVSRNLGL